MTGHLMTSSRRLLGLIAIGLLAIGAPAIAAEETPTAGTGDAVFLAPAITDGLESLPGEVIESPPPPVETVEYYGNDALGSVRVVFAPNGSVIGRADYMPFGETIAGANLPAEQFTGQARDAEAGLDYFGARYYQPRSGRFGTLDPSIAGAVINPQRWNRYAYALNNPLRFIDPTGAEADQCTQSSNTKSTNAGDDTKKSGCGEDWSLGDFLSDLALALGTTVGDIFGGVANLKAPNSDGTVTSTPIEPSTAARAMIDVGLLVAAIATENFAFESGAMKEAVAVDVAMGETKATTSLVNDLEAAAGRAVNQVGPGKGGAYGTKVHTAFENEVKAFGRSDVSTEVSYLDHEVVDRGTAGSVRLDVVEGPLNAPTAIYDLKTGSATLTPGRIQQIRDHLPIVSQTVPIIEIRPPE